MKYSISGNLAMADGSAVVPLLNKYTLWRLITEQGQHPITQESIFTFEVWLNTEVDKTNLFNELKPFVGINGEVINWHNCTHDEDIPQPCVIVEEYRG
jgi:hypothetical protein